MGRGMGFEIKGNNARVIAIVLLFVIAVLWSTGGLLIKSVNAHPLAISGSRAAIASLVLFLARGRRPFRINRDQALAAVSYAITVILFVAANKSTTAANAILLQFTAPIYVAILGVWLLKERTNAYDWITVAVTLVGMALFFTDGLSTRGLAGNIMALVSGLTLALFTIFMRRQKDGSPVDAVLLGNMLTAVVGLPFLAAGPMPDATGWLCLVVLGVFQVGIPYVLYSAVIRHTTALETILIPVLEPLLSPVWVLLLLGEQPTKWALIGGGIVITAITARCIWVAMLQRREAALEVAAAE